MIEFMANVYCLVRKLKGLVGLFDVDVTSLKLIIGKNLLSLLTSRVIF